MGVSSGVFQVRWSTFSTASHLLARANRASHGSKSDNKEKSKENNGKAKGKSKGAKGAIQGAPKVHARVMMAGLL